MEKIIRDHEAEAKANAEIARDCHALGYDILSPWDMVGQYHAKYELTLEIAEVFAKHLAKSHPHMVLQGLMSAGAWYTTRNLFMPPVLKILREKGDSYLGQGAANALLRMADYSDANLFAELIADKLVGGSRSLLIEGYAKLAKQKAIPLLRASTFDPVLRSEALKALSKLGDQTMRGELEKLAQHPDSYHRKIARDGLKRLDKKLEKMIAVGQRLTIN
jgi:hypothetical protein